MWDKLSCHYIVFPNTGLLSAFNPLSLLYFSTQILLHTSISNLSLPVLPVLMWVFLKKTKITQFLSFSSLFGVLHTRFKQVFTNTVAYGISLYECTSPQELAHGVLPTTAVYMNNILSSNKTTAVCLFTPLKSATHTDDIQTWCTPTLT